MGQIDIIDSSFSLPLVSWTSHLVPWCGAKISPHPCPTTFVWVENPCGVKRGEASQVRWGKIAIHTGKVNRQDAHYISYPSIKDYSLEHLIKLFKLLKEKKKKLSHCLKYIIQGHLIFITKMDNYAAFKKPLWLLYIQI